MQVTSVLFTEDTVTSWATSSQEDWKFAFASLWFKKKVINIWLCLFVAASHQTRLDTWSKVRRLIKVEIKGRGKVGNEPRLEPCWSTLLIGSLGTMWAWWGKQFHEPKRGSGHVCRVMAWTRQQGLVPYIGFENPKV